MLWFGKSSTSNPPQKKTTMVCGHSCQSTNNWSGSDRKDLQETTMVCTQILGVPVKVLNKSGHDSS